MIPKYRKATYIGIGGGFAISSLIGIIIGVFDEKMNIVGMLLSGFFLLVGAGFYLWGCSSWAKGKGHSGIYGILLGVLGILGLLILLVLPDKHNLNKNLQE